MADPLELLADSLGCILARTLYREHLDQESMQRELDELDALAARTQHLAPTEGDEDALTRGSPRDARPTNPPSLPGR